MQTQKVAPCLLVVCNIRLATTESWKDKSTGEEREITEWHRVVMYRKLAEIAGQYLKKGSQVYIGGRSRTRKWQDQSGAERYSTEIEASERTMLGSKAGSIAPATFTPSKDNSWRNDVGAGKVSKEPEWLRDDPDDYPF